VDAEKKDRNAPFSVIAKANVKPIENREDQIEACDSGVPARPLSWRPL